LIFGVCNFDSAIIVCFITIPLGFRNFSTPTQNGINNIKPAVEYTNADTQKLEILRDNRIKAEFIAELTK